MLKTVQRKVACWSYNAGRVWCLCQLSSKSRKWGLKALSVHGGKGWNCSSTAHTSCPKRPWGSDILGKRKLKKLMWNLKLLNFIFKVTEKKDDEKAPPKKHNVCKMRNRRKITWLAGPYTTAHFHQSSHFSRPIFLPVVLRSPELFLR